MNEHVSRSGDEALLADLATGARAVTDPDVQRAFAADPALRAEWEAIAKLAGALEGARVDVRDEVARARATASAQDRAAAESFLRDYLRVAPRRRLRGPLLLALAALLLAALAVAFWPRQPSPGELPTHLGSGDVRCIAPVRHAEAWTQFVWSEPPPSGGSYRIEVYDHATGAGADPVAVGYDLEATTWQPTPDELARIRSLRTWRWDLILIMPDRDNRVAASASVSR